MPDPEVVNSYGILWFVFVVISLGFASVIVKDYRKQIVPTMFWFVMSLIFLALSYLMLALSVKEYWQGRAYGPIPARATMYKVYTPEEGWFVLTDNNTGNMMPVLIRAKHRSFRVFKVHPEDARSRTMVVDPYSIRELVNVGEAFVADVFLPDSTVLLGETRPKREDKVPIISQE